MDRLRPTLTGHLFPPLHQELVALLRGLTPDQWQSPTSAGAWQVRDVVAHLLDGNLRRLALGRDGHRLSPDRPIDGYEQLVRWLNALNAEWIRAARRLSPTLLIELLEFAAPKTSAYMAALPADGPALFAVTWAGEDESRHWFDIGREYTEQWHHQMQIRDAVGAAGLIERRWLHPILELAVRALPHAYAGIAAGTAKAITIDVTGEAGGTWSVVREASGWTLFGGEASEPALRVEMDADTAWRLFFNNLPAHAARNRANITGDTSLAAPLFTTRALMV